MNEAVRADSNIIVRAFFYSLAFLLVAGGIGVGIWFWVASASGDVDQITEFDSISPEPVPDPRSVVQVPKVRFVDVTKEAGIDFVHESGADGRKLLPEIMTAGVALFDYDNDGDLDIFFANFAPWPSSSRAATDRPTQALYRNDGNWRFTNVTKEAGLDVTMHALGVAVGDYDNDGWNDLYVSALLGEARMFRNLGNGRFEDVTDRVGLRAPPEEFQTSCGFLDYDRDGDLDLFVCRYVVWNEEINESLFFRLENGVRGMVNPRQFAGTHCRLFRNDDGVFSDVSQEAGIEVNNLQGKPLGKALGVVFLDVNRDGWCDIVVANDTVRNFLFLNQQDGTFREVGQEYQVAFGPYGIARSGMGIDAADFRNNGTLGIAVGNFSGEMTGLFVSKPGSHVFSDEAMVAGLGVPTTKPLTFGVCFFDYDLDGWLDFAQANGHVEPDIAATEEDLTYPQPPQLFWNCGPMSRKAQCDFIEVKPEDSGPDFFKPIVGRGIVAGDLDGDGDLDVVITGIGSAPRVLRNDQQLGHHWLRLHLVGKHCNRNAYGAEVTLTAGKLRQWRCVSATRSYLSQCESTLTFGLGKYQGEVQLEITWPCGKKQSLTIDKLDQLLRIEEPE